MPDIPIFRTAVHVMPKNRRGRVEQRLLAGLRSPWAGAIGTVVSVAAFTLLVRRLVAEGGDAMVLRRLEPGKLAVGLGGFLVFQAAAVGILELLGGRASARLWASAQVVKYLPIPGSALLGMAGGAVRTGYGTADALRLVARHTGVLAGAAVAVGAPAAATAAEEALGLPPAVTIPLALVAGVLLASWSARHVAVRVRVGVVVLACAAWSMLGVALWASAAAGGDALIVVSSFSAGWVVGLAVLPVPAGLGVREFVLALLLESQLGTDGALAYAVVTRVLHISSDGLFALTVAIVTRWRLTDRGSLG